MSSIPEGDKQTLGPRQIATERLDDWRYLAGRLHARFATGSFAVGLALVDEIAAEAERADHHPDLDLRYAHLHVALFSHDVAGVTARDVRLARSTSEIAARLGVGAEPSALQVVDLAIDTADAEEIRPFWQAVLGLRPDSGNDAFLFDPDGYAPGVFLQPTAPHDPPRQRFHVDVEVPPDVAQERVRRALAAGGVLVTDQHAPAWWTLADAQGNKADIATWEGRDA